MSHFGCSCWTFGRRQRRGLWEIVETTRDARVVKEVLSAFAIKIRELFIMPRLPTPVNCFADLFFKQLDTTRSTSRRTRTREDMFLQALINILKSRTERNKQFIRAYTSSRGAGTTLFLAAATTTLELETRAPSAAFFARHPPPCWLMLIVLTKPLHYRTARVLYLAI